MGNHDPSRPRRSKPTRGALMRLRNAIDMTIGEGEAVKQINPKYLIAALRALPKGCTVSVSRVSQDIDVYSDTGRYFGWLESNRDGEVVFKAGGR